MMEQFSKREFIIDHVKNDLWVVLTGKYKQEKEITDGILFYIII